MYIVYGCVSEGKLSGCHQSCLVDFTSQTKRDKVISRVEIPLLEGHFIKLYLAYSYPLQMRVVNCICSQSQARHTERLVVEIFKFASHFYWGTFPSQILDWREKPMAWSFISRVSSCNRSFSSGISNIINLSLSSTQKIALWSTKRSFWSAKQL